MLIYAYLRRNIKVGKPQWNKFDHAIWSIIRTQIEVGGNGYFAPKLNINGSMNIRRTFQMQEHILARNVKLGRTAFIDSSLISDRTPLGVGGISGAKEINESQRFALEEARKLNPGEFIRDAAAVNSAILDAIVYSRKLTIPQKRELLELNSYTEGELDGKTVELGVMAGKDGVVRCESDRCIIITQFDDKWNRSFDYNGNPGECLIGTVVAEVLNPVMQKMYPRAAEVLRMNHGRAPSTDALGALWHAFTTGIPGEEQTK